MKHPSTPQANRLHIALFGRTNSGKSSLVNALTGQDVALVSDKPGTTTDPVMKAMEIHGIGACTFIDTPGFDDTSELGEKRIERTIKAMDRADIALMLCQPDMQEELHWLELLRKKKIPTILILNKADIRSNSEEDASIIKEKSGEQPIIVSALLNEGIEEIRHAITAKLPEDYDAQSITRNLVTEGEIGRAHV